MRVSSLDEDMIRQMNLVEYSEYEFSHTVRGHLCDMLCGNEVFNRKDSFDRVS